MARTKFMFSTDFHGSETVWRKFLNSARYFDLDALVMSGDMTSKVIVPIVKRSDGKHDAHFKGEDYVLDESQLPEFEKECRMVAYMPYRTTTEEAAHVAADEQYREDLFERLECQTIEAWLSLIPGRVPDDVRIVMSPGNDDKFAIDECIRAFDRVIFGEEEVVSLDDEHEVLCFGWSNPTPFNSPRECSEEEMEARLEATVAQVQDLRTAVFCIHAPPFKSLIDEAPAVDEQMRQIVRGGRLVMVPVGSKAVRKIIEKHQPLVALHGHIHESPGYVRIGRTQCLNPGSEYNEGIFKGYLVEIEGDKILQLRRVES
ncbi:MAG: metallophosphoesterase [Anaerolineae bacterium]|nr:MAG: metallophosphoesterase [Anaerolineae bacterium]